MRTNRIFTLAFALLVVGASAATAVACPNNDKSASNTSYASAGKGDCAAHSSTVTADAKGNCPATKDCPASACPYGAKGTSAVAASATHESGCGMSKSATASGACGMHGASAAGNCTFGKNAVTMAGGVCAVGHEADYAFAVKGADCQGTSQSAAKAIKAMKGVASVTVDYAHHMAYVCADGRTCDETQIVSCLKKAGFADAKFVNADKANCAKSHGKVQA